MLTVRCWRSFFVKNFYGLILCGLPIVLLPLFFSPGLSYMGGDTSSLIYSVFKDHTLLVLGTIGSITVVSIILSLFLFLTICSFNILWVISLSFVFYLSCLQRVIALYPSISESWFIYNKSEIFRLYVKKLSLLPIDSWVRFSVEWAPFIFTFLFFSINIFIFLINLNSHGKLISKLRSSIDIDVYDQESKVFSILGLSFLISFISGIIFLINIFPSFNSAIPQKTEASKSPNVFIFAIDSLRYDRVKSEKFKSVIPFIQNMAQTSEIFKPMLVGVPRTFPSWVEIATGTYALTNGVRTMFPLKNSRIGDKNTVFTAAQNNGFKTIFVSDFAGDIFPRYPFGAHEINAPSSNLKTLVENGIISFFSPLQSLLVHPKLHRTLPSLLESAEVSDPRLVSKTFAEVLKRNNDASPLFITTFFSTAHFPYAAPAPWFSKFQDKTKNLIYKKVPDQVLEHDGKEVLITEETKIQTHGLYDGALNAIDESLKSLFENLEQNGWLDNAIVLVFGDHGENLYEGNLGMGHGDGVQGEYSNVTPLIIKPYGLAANILKYEKDDSFVRNIDIAPSISTVLNLKMDKNLFDGVSLFENNFNTNFSSNNAYMESGIWFTSGELSPEKAPRINYPGVISLLNVDENTNYEFVLNTQYIQSIPSIKERAWINKDYRLVQKTTRQGVISSLYKRDDLAAENDLLNIPDQNSDYVSVSQKMTQELNEFLTRRGVDIIKNRQGAFFYSENLAQ